VIGAAAFLLLDEARNPPRFDDFPNASLLLLLLIVGLIGARGLFAIFKYGQPSESVPRPENIRAWVHMAALGIMLLAIFAFGIEIDNQTGHVTLRWSEIPAILIVFVLAELGGELVATAATIKEDVANAATSASAAADSAKVVEVDLNSAVSRLETSKSALERASSQAESTHRGLTAATQALTHGVDLIGSVDEFRHYAALSPDRVWSTLKDFVDSWRPDAIPHEREYHLVGLLFKSFIEGRGEHQGTIRCNDSAVSCVTVDTVFGNVSRAWLNETKPSDLNEQVVVWALTSLLPTEFALPRLWWGPSGTHQYRGRTLEEFISTVIEYCGRGRTLEYQRVTVLRGSNVEAIELPGAWALCDDEPKEGEDFRSSRRIPTEWLRESLTNWFVRDPRIEGIGSNDIGRLRRYATTVADAEVTLADGIGDLSPDYFRDIGGDPEKYLNLHTLPKIERVDFKEFHHELPNGKKLAVAAVSDRLLKKIDGAGKSFRSKCAEEGWQPLGEWYCSRLHKPRKPKGHGAWWVTVEDPQQIESLSLDWDGHTWRPMDLLLIGLRSEGDVRRWLGAAISNLRFDDPACVVKLVTREQDLTRIAKTVSDLVGDFEAPTGENPSYNTWHSFFAPRAGG